jgi:hypothetical protein
MVKKKGEETHEEWNRHSNWYSLYESQD